nr:MAG TPA: hypothetical protein [Caudoviricetes sp.]
MPTKKKNKKQRPTTGRCHKQEPPIPQQDDST